MIRGSASLFFSPRTPAWRTLLWTGAFSAAGLATSSAGILDWLKRGRDLQVVTVTEMTPEGAKIPRPTPEAPAYYVAITTGLTDFGAVKGGGDKLPPKKLVYETIARVLASQGLRPATEKTPAPAYMIIFSWGTLNADMDTLSTNDPDAAPLQWNRSKILRFIGAYKNGAMSLEREGYLPPGWSVRSADEERLWALSQEDLYVVTISAFDFEAAKRKEKKLLWVTRVSCPSIGFTMSDAVPAMIVTAGPNIGRDTPRPVWVNTRDKFKGHVDLGDPVVTQYLESGDSSGRLPSSPAAGSAPGKEK